MTDDFWFVLDQVISESQIVIDRPQGSVHPRFPNVIYPLDYGYLEGTTAMDGSGIDLWKGSNKGSGLSGLLLTVDQQKRDAEVKLLLDCTQEEIRITLAFLNQGTMRAILIPRKKSRDRKE
jgi:inorganic pyrophosphatase